MGSTEGVSKLSGSESGQAPALACKVRLVEVACRGGHPSQVLLALRQQPSAPVESVLPQVLSGRSSNLPLEPALHPAPPDSGFTSQLCDRRPGWTPSQPPGEERPDRVVGLLEPSFPPAGSQPLDQPRQPLGGHRPDELLPDRGCPGTDYRIQGLQAVSHLRGRHSEELPKASGGQPRSEGSHGVGGRHPEPIGPGSEEDRVGAGLGLSRLPSLAEAAAEVEDEVTDTVCVEQGVGRRMGRGRDPESIHHVQKVRWRKDLLEHGFER